MNIQCLITGKYDYFYFTCCLSDVSIAFYEIRWKTAYEVGQLLTEKEIQRLMERYHLEDNDVIKTCVERNKRLFLAGVLTHEMW